jgi:cobalt-zinc-cadmium efflux system membrane fusion protein
MRPVCFVVSLVFAAVSLVGCGSREKVDAAAAAPPPARVTEEPDLNIVKVDRPERFKLVTACPREDLPQVQATGSVTPDVERSVPVVSLASGRVVAIYAKLGDDVNKGRLLLKVLSNDISNAFQSYSQAKADEDLARRQLERAKLLYDRGAISLNDLQVAEGTEEKAKVTLNAAAQQIRTLGGDPAHQDAVVNVYAPVSGTIVEQNVVQSASVRTPDNQPNLFTIADLSKVWVICDVYENDLPLVRVGDAADVRLNAYPDRRFRGRISNIGKMLDPTLRTAKVRIDLANPGIMRAGMFVTATFYGLHGRTYASVPSSAVLHLHDRDWVFVPAGNGNFRRTEITTGKIVDGQQDILSGISPGQQVVNDALDLNAESQQ